MGYSRGVRICTAGESTGDFLFTYEPETVTPQHTAKKQSRKNTFNERMLILKLHAMTLAFIASWAIILTGALS